MTNPAVSVGADSNEMREELRAVLHAGRELPARMDSTVIDAFLQRLDEHVDARIADARIATRAVAPGPATAGDRALKKTPPVATLAVGIPLVVLAGVFGATAGVIIALLVIGALAGYQAIRE